MCGIAGIYSKDNNYYPDKKTLLSMAHVMKHRGPDDEGVYIDKGIGLAHQRLSIIDVSSKGKQPMSNEDGSIWIVFNGEIYNYLGMKKMLLKQGHIFKSHTDTEVLIHLYEEKKYDMVNELNGMFAFALWDSRKKILFLGRDRFGVKPLYYTYFKNQFLFASEIKALLSYPGVCAIPNPEAVIEHFSFNFTLDNKTFFKNIFMLLPGYYMVLDEERQKITSYWDIEYTPNKHIRYEEALKTVGDLFEDSVKSQLMSDVPVGAFASGGMDSSSVATLAAASIRNINTFSCGFDVRGLPQEEQKADERYYGRMVAKNIGSIHHELVVKNKDLEKSISSVVWHLDEPKAGISYPPYLIAQKASTYVKVVLAGHGGDEYFGGYPWRHRIGLRAKTFDSFADDYFKAWCFIIPYEEQKKAIKKKILSQGCYNTLAERFINTLQSVKAESFVDKSLGFDAKHFLTALLIVEDKLGMAHSLETRVPFLDNNFIEYILQLPSAFKINNQFHKIILQDTLKQYLPQEIYNRPKVGFGPPDNAWYRTSLKPFILKVLTSRKAYIYDYFNRNYVRQLLDSHMSGRQNLRRQIWSFLVFEYWLKLFVAKDHK